MEKLTDQEKKVLKFCSEKWFGNPAGISALDLERKFGLSNADGMLLFEGLVGKGLGKINANVTLYQVSLDFEESGGSLPEGKEVITHIFFPSKEVLAKHFFRSKKAKEEIPEYTKRLHLGANQIALVFFEEEVLGKYFDHPEKYKIEDTLAGGTLTTNWETEEEETGYLHVRYGKKLINGGAVAVTALYTDLSKMSPNEQKYWGSFEVKEFVPDLGDENFRKFLLRAYEGEFVDFPDPIADLTRSLREMNSAIGEDPLFLKTENIHLRPPVENTRKAYCDSCSELYKLVGPDNIKRSVLKDFMIGTLNVLDNEMKNKESGRDLSSIQMLSLAESRLVSNSDLTSRIEMIKTFRVEADHKISDGGNPKDSYTWRFGLLCEETAFFISELAKRVLKLRGPDF